MKIRFGFCPGGPVSVCRGSAEEAHAEPAAANECWTNSLLVVSSGLQLGLFLFSIPESSLLVATTHFDKRRLPGIGRSTWHRCFPWPKSRLGYQRCVSAPRRENAFDLQVLSMCRRTSRETGFSRKFAPQDSPVKGDRENGEAVLPLD